MIVIGWPEYIFIGACLVIGCVVFAGLMFLAQSAGSGAKGSASGKCPNCGRNLAGVKIGWFGAFGRCPYCGNKQNIHRSTEMQRRLDSGYYDRR